MDKELVGFILGNLTIFTAFTGILIHYRAKRQRQISEERLRFLERFESADEVSRFLESGSGQRVLDSLGSPRSDPRRTILAILPLGFGGLLIGLGLLFAIHLESLPMDLALVAVIFVGSGLGILISAVVSQRLMRNWGMMGDDGRSAPPPPRPTANPTTRPPAHDPHAERHHD